MSKAVANLTQSTETITFSAQDNGETITVNVTEAARGPAGAAGAAGPNSVTSATTSDGTANLSLSNVTTATAEVTGTLIASHIHGNLAGSVYAHVRAGENLAKGDPVYISGSHGSGSTLIAIVSKADASDPLKMPAVGVMDAAVTANANGHMVITGTISDINTATYSVNSELYVAEGGGFTANPPRDYAQPVARVERSNTNNGAVIVKVNGLSAIAETPQTLVRRDTAGSVEAYSLRVATDPFTGFTTTLEANNDGSLESAVVLTLPLKSGYLATTGNSDGVVNIANGGTNATTASSARTNLGLGTGDTPSFSGLTLTNALALTSGGTGATSAANARTNLGLGTASTPTFANLTLATGAITTSQPLSLTQTWNAAGVTFKGIDVNVTDTASASGSLLMDLRVGGNPYFSIEKDGSTRLYRTYSSSTNFERLNLKYTGTAFQIGTEKGSAGGTARPLEFQTDGTTRMTIGATGISLNIGVVSSSLTTFINSTGGNAVAFSSASPSGFYAENTAASSSTGGAFNALYSNDAVAMASGDRLGGFLFGGSSSASSLRNTAIVHAFASENWVDASSYGTRIEFGTTANGTTTRATRLIIGNSGAITLGANESNAAPALKPSSTIIQARLADDSAYTTIDAQHRLQGTAPASATAAGTAGDIRYDANYIYICTATNTWKRAALATWP